MGGRVLFVVFSLLIVQYGSANERNASTSIKNVDSAPTEGRKFQKKASQFVDIYSISRLGTYDPDRQFPLYFLTYIETKRREAGRQSIEDIYFEHHQTRLTDCIFKVGPDDDAEIITANRRFVKECGIIFENALFFTSYLRIKNITANHLRQILQYCYTGEICFDNYADACKIMKHAIEFSIPEIVDSAYSYLFTNMYPDNIFQGYDCANDIGDYRLRKNALTLIQRNATRALRHPMVKVLTACHMHGFLFCGKHLVTESVMYNWAKYQISKLGEELERSFYDIVHNKTIAQQCKTEFSRPLMYLGIGYAKTCPFKDLLTKRAMDTHWALTSNAFNIPKGGIHILNSLESTMDKSRKEEFAIYVISALSNEVLFNQRLTKPLMGLKDSARNVYLHLVGYPNVTDKSIPIQDYRSKIVYFTRGTFPLNPESEVYIKNDYDQFDCKVLGVDSTLSSQ